MRATKGRLGSANKKVLARKDAQQQILRKTGPPVLKRKKEKIVTRRGNTLPRSSLQLAERETEEACSWTSNNVPREIKGKWAATHILA